MKQAVQNLRGEVRLLEVPPPALRAGGVIVRTVASVISPGTERTNVVRSRRSLLARARERPDLMRQVLGRIRKEGVGSVFRAVHERLDEWIPMGYSSAGVVEAVGEGVTDLRVGDLVACGGGGYAVHAELTWVPRNLVAKVPSGVPAEAAAFATLGAIALQGIRQAEPTLGETVAVIGLGLLGQLTVQMLRAAGCQVIATDLDAGRRALAATLGATIVSGAGAEFEDAVRRGTGGRGADAVIITASSSSAEPVRQAGVVTRDRGRVVVVGAVPVDVPRSPYYEKELDVRFSRSYGPGRYDPAYEEGGHDYPLGYVRWTEQRNLEAFVALVADGRVAVAPLVSHRFPIARAEDAYRELTSGATSMGMVLEYPGAVSSAAPPAPWRSRPATAGQLGIALVGPGSFAKNVLLPAIRAVPDVALRGVVASTGLSGQNRVDRGGFAYATTDLADVLADPSVHAVFIATRHHLHAEQVRAALAAGKHVFVEKPLCLREEELVHIIAAERSASEAGVMLMVGFNRRFSPHMQRIRELFTGRTQPLQLHYRVNAGQVPATHWVHDPEVGGGRILGEGCHFVDTMAAIVDRPIRRIAAESTSRDGLSGLIGFEDGSVATLVYAGGGHQDVPKEWLEVIGGGTVAQLDDFTALRWWAPTGPGELRLRTQDKGHRQEVAAFLGAIRGAGPAPIPFAELAAVTRATFRLVESAAVGMTLPLEPAGEPG